MSKRQIDRSTVFGVLVALAGVIAGLWLDGGSIRQILQPTAALIVLAGTLGAVMIQFPTDTLLETIKQLPQAFFNREPLCADAIEELVGYCTEIRRGGILRLDAKLSQIDDLFLRKALTLAVDGAQVRDIRENMEVDLDLYDEREYSVVKVLDSAGGFAPTLGIMGAVLGLIQVMQRMDNVAEIGRGIAVALRLDALRPRIFKLISDSTRWEATDTHETETACAGDDARSSCVHHGRNRTARIEREAGLLSD